MWNHIKQQRHAITFGFLLLCLLKGRFINCQLGGRSNGYMNNNSNNDDRYLTQQNGALTGTQKSQQQGKIPSHATLLGTNQQEPTCEALRAMWLYTKRQSRASELTNELPTYRDPFRLNYFEPFHANSRSMASTRMGSAQSREPIRRQLVFGRVMHTEPMPDFQQRMNHGKDRGNGSNNNGADAFAGSSRMGGSARSPDQPTSRRRQHHLNGLVVPQKGSFQILKEIISSERANELEQQRRNEDIARRAALLKEMSKGLGYVRRPKQLGMIVGEFERSYNKPLLRYARERDMPNKRTAPLINMLSLESSNYGNKIDMNEDDIVNGDRAEENYDNIDYDNKNNKNNNENNNNNNINYNNADKFNYNDNDSSSEDSESSQLYKHIPQLSKTNFNGRLPIMNARQQENLRKSSFYGIGGGGNGLRSYFDDRNGYALDLDDGDD